MAPAAIATIWGDVLDRFRIDYPHLFRGWFHDLTANDLVQGVLQIEPKNQWQAAYLAQSCTAQLARAAQLVTDRLLSVNIAPPPSDIAARHETAVPPDPELTFSTFVVGPENQLAHAAAMSASRTLRATQNPILLIGPSAAGKTHLLQAACCHVAQEHPTSVWRYQTATGFAARFMQACEEDRTGDFRCEYTGLDLLAIDDVHELAPKDRSQEEFFHILVSRIEHGRQVILASKQPPAAIEGLAHRLSSRFTAGLVAPLDYPCLETRLKLTARLAGRRGLSLSDEAVTVVAEACPTAADVSRAIERLAQASTTTGGLVEAETARGMLDNQGGVSAQSLLSLVAACFGLSGSNLRRRRQPRTHKAAREAAVYLTRSLTGLALADIADFYELTVAELLDVTRCVSRDMAQDPKMAALLDEIARKAKNARCGTNDSCPWN
jgi:chromosomal replication initiator protein